MRLLAIISAANILALLLILDAAWYVYVLVALAVLIVLVAVWIGQINLWAP
jgi:hypothetical protein